MSNGRCQPGIFKNTPNANLIRKDIFKVLGIKESEKGPSRLLRRLDEFSDYEDDEGWDTDKQPAKVPTEKPQEKIKDKKKPKIPLLGASKKSKKDKSKKKSLQSDEEFESDAEQYSCWCYMDGKRSWKCPQMSKKFKQKHFK